MTKEKILLTLKNLKPQYEKEGFLILGLLGSYAKGAASDDSDVDILYDLNESVYLQKYKGFRAVGRLADIKDELRSTLHTDVDIADVQALGKVGKKYILSETVYV
jgi:uncharacterized protein